MEEFLQKIEPFEFLYKHDFWVLFQAYLSSLTDKDLLELYVRKFPDNKIFESVLKKRDAKRLGAIQHTAIIKLIENVNQHRLSSKEYSDYATLVYELQVRCVFASEKDKRRILEMLLDGDELERSRAYLLLSECWDNYFYDKIISLLPPQYQTTNAAAEFDKYVDITKHCADNR